MPRVARIVIADVAHHITQRGNNRQDVFFVDEDRQVYLDLLQVQCQRYGFTATGYCLMTNHVHLIGTPAREASLAKAIGRTHFLYIQYINRLHRRSGHLWQNRFYSCPMDAAHALQALCYVELNPVRAGMLKTSMAPSKPAPADQSGPSPLSLCTTIRHLRLFCRRSITASLSDPFGVVRFFRRYYCTPLEPVAVVDSTMHVS